MAEIAKVGVIGLGYIGLPTAALLANHGLEVHGVDIRAAVVDAVSKGSAPIHEPGLNQAVASCVSAGRLKAATQAAPCDAFILAVPTPFKGDHVPDLSSVDAAAAAIAPFLRAGNLVILESTSPVGTTERLARQLAAARPDLRFPADGLTPHDVHVAYCPERVLPGQILRELVENARVIGGLGSCCSERAIALYQTFVTGECHATSARAAELVKLSENAFRDVNIAFANELSIIADGLEVDVNEVIRLANLHPRVSILKPGAGVGGHCIAVDPWFIVDSAPEASRLIRTARLVNDAKPRWVVDKILQAAAARDSPRVACLGLSYKADVDDLRESPAISVIQQIQAHGVAPILVHDPFIRSLPRELRLPGVALCDLARALEDANVIALLTPHREYRALSREQLGGKTLVDPSGAWLP